ncbi:hypothetical protein BN14_05993 [Rhizoctonia solani AG-1 IB]|uniref:Uncharacterized protein n=1 Tax=Thanatephorus cucumeris (strain AG1-IB / isolate 7/3/14) TaxID=1108050 RepID=M5BXN7_THACB|nr:hypothetical protein BN14_05993 [Rhizoctonia solani AG-1 IB]
MAQPDLGIDGKSLRNFTTQAPLTANHPEVNQVTQLQEMLRAMEVRLSEKITQSEQRTSAHTDELNTRIDLTNAHIDKINAQITHLAHKMQLK